MNELNKYLVAVRCYTYRHVNYIKDALDGFCMQQTNFPYICIVVDDASTDGEQDVINHYLVEHFNLEDKSISWTRDAEEGVYTYAQHKTNKSCFFLSLNLKKNLYGALGAKMNLIAEWNEACKYHALCEGDDYWTDPLKLQKQVDYMESHPKCVMCYHNAWQTWGEQRRIFVDSSKQGTSIGLEELLSVWHIPTASILYRRDAETRASKLNPHPNGDYCLELRLKSRGEIHYNPAIMSVYRMHGDSMSAGMNRNKVKMYQDIIDLLQDARTLYLSDNDQLLFDAAVKKYENLIRDYKISTHPIKKWFYRKTYTRAIKKWLRKLFNNKILHI